jgi:hypothetical protein
MLKGFARGNQWGGNERTLAGEENWKIIYIYLYIYNISISISISISIDIDIDIYLTIMNP